MPKKINIPIGSVFGCRTVIADKGVIHGVSFVECQCKCGAIKTIPSSVLRSKPTRRCHSCYFMEENGKLISVVIGGNYKKWTVIKRMEGYRRGHRKHFYLCECECGSRSLRGMFEILSPKGSTSCIKCAASKSRQAYVEKRIKKTKEKLKDE